ncbi:MAG: hypothetical protein E7047_09550 [Lentisphaerae bacterium]|nr:hypothetical protein [Lentisphaerota bacterium]
MNSARIVARRIADGVKNHCYAGRISVADHRITLIEPGDFAPEPGDIAVSADKILAPGFIDAHGHSDLSLLAMPEAEGKTRQGIVYEIAGNCGLSPFPLTELNRAHLQELYKQYQTALTWNSFAEYQQQLSRCAPALKLFSLVGHNTLRAAAAGYEKQALSASEISTMCDLLDRELMAGAIGLSLGLLYTPGCFADKAEIVALMQVLARHNKICTVHLKSESTRLEEALRDTLSAAQSAGLQKLHLSHLKTAGEANFHKINAIIEALESTDLQVTGDVYCYTASMTQLSVILPAPFDNYDDVKNMQLLQNHDIFRELLTQVRKERSSDYWQKVQLISSAPPFDKFCGRFFSKIARQQQIEPEELFLQLLRNDATGTTAAFHTLSEANMLRLIAHPSVVPGSDESARNICSGPFGQSHPRGFGNHARYFKLRQSQGADPAQIIREMSAQTAEIFDLPDVGAIKPTYEAVFNILDPEQYCDHASYEMPHIPTAGVETLKL